MRLKLIACEVLYRELCRLVADSPHTVDAEFLPKGLHDLGSERMVARLQERIDAVPAERYEGTLLGYALCNNGVAGLAARGLPLVIPRAHDCITLFMGSRERYREYFAAHPSTYYRTSGWFEREDPSGVGDLTVQQKLGLFQTYESLAEKYGEDNARYIIETMGDPTAHYDRIAFISLGLPCEEPFRCRAMDEALQKGWTFDEVAGSLALLRKLVNAEWDGDFLVLKPGETIRASHDEGIVRPEGGTA